MPDPDNDYPRHNPDGVIVDMDEFDFDDDFDEDFEQQREEKIEEAEAIQEGGFTG